MDKCSSLIAVAVVVWSQMTSGRTIQGVRQDAHERFHHAFEHHDPGHWHEGQPQWDATADLYAPQSLDHEDLQPSASSNEKPFWRQHHAVDWDSERWPDYNQRYPKQWNQGSWPNQGWNQNRPNNWNQGRPHNWNNQGTNGWNYQAKPNSWNSQGSPWNNQASPNNWNDQGPNSWNNPNSANDWNQWGSQWGGNNWNSQGGSNTNQNSNNNRPTRVPQATTAAPDQLQITQCIRNCPVTPEYNPVCGSNNVTYSNEGRLGCAKYCGVDVAISRRSPCSVAGATTSPSIVITNSPIKDPEPTSRPDPAGPDAPPDFTISPDILSSIFTTTEDENVDIDIRTRNRMGARPQFVAPVQI